MATDKKTEVVLRLEKVDGKKVFYVEFQQEHHNTLLRLWNTYDVNGRPESRNERENFHTPEDAKAYLKNQVKAYEKQGFKVVFDRDAKAVPTGETIPDLD